jgi:hypothetical protein
MQNAAKDTMANISKIQLIRQEGFPVQISVKINGVLPDTCTTFKNIDQRRKDYLFTINLVTQRSTTETCNSSEAPFELEVPLELEGIPAGEYKVKVNGVEDKFKLDQDNIIE